MKHPLIIASLLLGGFARGQVAPPQPERLAEFHVAGDRVGRTELVVPRGDLRPPEPNLGQELLAIPGVQGHARAADAMEPAVRGLGLDRVATTLNGLPLLNASPERTNSPVVILGGAAITHIAIHKALPSVTLGPVTTGGRIALNSDPAVGRAGVRDTSAVELATTYQGARDGLSLRGRATVRAGSWEGCGTVFRNKLGDYAAADGQTVAATLDDQGASVAVARRTDTRRTRVEFLHRRLRAQDTTALPLDGRNTESRVVTLTDRWSSDTGALASVDWRAGYAFTDPYITSEGRNVPARTIAEATARSFGTGVMSTWRLGVDDTIATGLDHSRQVRRAIRTTAAGRDYIWPDAAYEDTGAFAEWRRSVVSGAQIRLGVRADHVRSEARDADKAALGRSIREQYALYNGAAAAKTKRRETVGAANVLLEASPSKRTSWFAGIGVSTQPAGVMERYRAFLNALGGDGRGGSAVELGNPDLAPERKWAAEVGGTFRGSNIDLEATAYWYHIDDFILRLPVGDTQPPLPRMVVFGYRNIEADLHGAELAATFKLGEHWRIPVTFAVADGRNRDTGAGLADMPPWEAGAAIRYRPPWPPMLALELGSRVAGHQRNPAPRDNPLFAETGGFAVFHLRGGIPLGRHLKVEAGVENLFDRWYTEYLTPPVGPVRPASGNLRPGQRVPGPGRSAWVAMTMTW